MNLGPKHWAIIAGLITGVIAQLLTVQHSCSGIVTPGLAAGLLIQIASTLAAIFVGAPGPIARLAQANKKTEMAHASTRATLSAPIDLGRVDPKRFVEPAE
jgi:hypothetical protein